MQHFDEAGDAEGPVEVGHFCLWREDATEPYAPAGACTNAPPYIATRTDSVSINGTRATTCDLSATTCPGFRGFYKVCSGTDDDATCGDPGFASDAYCREAAPSTYRCTTPCSSDADCLTGSTCVSATPRHCNVVPQ
jgi:hypothetical protein